MSRAGSLRRAVGAFVDRWRDARLGFAAAGIAYYALVSLLPALLLLFVVVTAVSGEFVATRLLSAVGDALSVAGESLIRRAITDDSGRSGLTALGLASLLWGAWRLFRGLREAFGMVASSEVPRQRLATRLRDATLALVSVALAVVVVLVTGELFPEVGIARVVGRVGQFVALAVVLFPVFYLLSGPEIGAVDAVPGAVVTAGGWSLLHIGFEVYLAFAGERLLFSVVGSLVLLGVWLYLASVVLLGGAVVNSVLAAAR